MKIGISVDSGSGIRPSETEELGINVVPMPFMVNGKEYFENVNIERDDFFGGILNEESEISTSQPSVESLMEMWDKMLLENDQIVHVPLTSGLSGSLQTAKMLSEEDKYEGKVFVADSRGVSVVQRRQAMFARELAEKGYDGSQIVAILERDKRNNQIYIGLDTLAYLKKGGRITPLAACVGTVLHIKPVLGITNGGKLDSFAKARTLKGEKEAIINGLKDELKGRLSDPGMNNCFLAVAYADDISLGENFKKELEKEFPDRLNKDIEVCPLSLLISCHTGPGIIAAAVIERPEELKR